jgi:catechol 2,3-dioxygenase-like lactoylglutathione lyase family enzyme
MGRFSALAIMVPQGVRSVDILVNIDVPDLETAIAFYRDGLGLKVGRRLGREAIELMGVSAPIYLLAKRGGSQAAETTEQRRDYDRHWTPIHLDFVVDNVERAVSRAVAAGARLESEPSAADWGTIAMLSDPFGNGFCILSFSGRGYEAIADPPETSTSPAS